MGTSRQDQRKGKEMGCSHGQIKGKAASPCPPQTSEKVQSYKSILLFLLYILFLIIISFQKILVSFAFLLFLIRALTMVKPSTIDGFSQEKKCPKSGG